MSYSPRGCKKSDTIELLILFFPLRKRDYLLSLKQILPNIKKIVLEECCCTVAKSCPTLHDPMDCGTPGTSVLHYLL